MIVLVEDGDAAVGMICHQVLPEDATFRLIVRLLAHGPRVIVRIIPFGRSGSDTRTFSKSESNGAQV